MEDVTIRPMRAADIAVAFDISHTALAEAGRVYGWETRELDDAGRARGERRLVHALRHDPGGAFVAVRGDDVVGMSVAIRRGALWFLSLLFVATDMQARGIGRRLLDAAMTTLGQSGAMCASSDPKALRRYWRAGFELQPCFEMKGQLDRALVPVAGRVREGAYARDGDLVEAVVTAMRGAPYGPDLELFASEDRPLFVVDSGSERGFVICADAGVVSLGATSPAAAARLLWTAFAEAPGPLDVLWISHDQQWAIDVALEARLEPRLVGSRCVKDVDGAMSPYLPSGLWG